MDTVFDAAGGRAGLLYHDSADDVPDGLRIPKWSWDGLQGDR